MLLVVTGRRKFGRVARAVDEVSERLSPSPVGVMCPECAPYPTTSRAVRRSALVIAGVAPYDATDLDWMAGMGEDSVAEFSAAAQGEGVLRPYLVEPREHLKDVTVSGLGGMAG
jgi:hypothetical protein